MIDFNDLRGKLIPVLPAQGEPKQEPSEEKETASNRLNNEPEQQPEVKMEKGALLKGPAPEKPVEPWLRDEPPDGVSNLTKWQLMHDMSEEEIIATGTNPNTVRICAQELERDGYRKRPKKPRDKDLSAYAPQGKGLRVFAQGSPPEAIVDTIQIPIDSEEGRIFEKGLKTGASLIILGVRVAQELSAVGIQQAKPIMDMAKTMREGEAIAAKGAASEAAIEAADRVAGIFGPVISSLQKPEGLDPMRGMLVRIMEPVVQDVIKKLVPGMSQQQPSGWTVEKE